MENNLQVLPKQMYWNGHAYYIPLIWAYNLEEALLNNSNWIAMDNLDTFEPLIILVFVFSRWQLFTWTMPTPTVIKTFRCNQKHRCGLLPAFFRSFSLSVRVSVAGKSFPQPRCHGSYRDNSCCLPDRVISGTTATHGLYIDCPDQSESVPVAVVTDKGVP